MNDVRAKFSNALLDPVLCAQPGGHRRDMYSAQPGGHRRDMYSIRESIHDGRAEPAPMGPAQDKRDLMLLGLKAREFRSVALGSGEPPGEDDMHDAHGRCVLQI